MNKQKQVHDSNALEKVLLYIGVAITFIFSSRRFEYQLIYTLIVIAIFSTIIYLMHGIFKDNCKLELLTATTFKTLFYLYAAAFFIIIRALYDFYYATYVGYGKLLILFYSLIISLILIKCLKIKIYSKRKHPKLFAPIILCICLVPILSQINIGLSFIHTKTVNAKIVNKEDSRVINAKGKPKYKYFISVDAENAPDIKGKILCRKNPLKPTATLNYKRGLLGVQFVEVIED